MSEHDKAESLLNAMREAGFYHVSEKDKPRIKCAYCNKVLAAESIFYHLEYDCMESPFAKYAMRVEDAVSYTEIVKLKSKSSMHRAIRRHRYGREEE